MGDCSGLITPFHAPGSSRKFVRFSPSGQPVSLLPRTSFQGHSGVKQAKAAAGLDARRGDRSSEFSGYPSFVTPAREYLTCQRIAEITKICWAMLG
ncbi:hypothetical protein NDA01_24145 [Trichocoleus desertorum AS-A10]|uniref:hypothetical protein n=1 Tax=Trichocoleus desertorum TaxID=1481672 RepID=UPI0032976E7B